MAEPEPQFTDTIVFESSLVRIGAFRCNRHHPRFHDTGPIQHDCFVFPRTAVGIEHEHEPAFAANPNVVTFYNRGQRYLRHAVGEQDDRCDWFGIDRKIVQDAVECCSSQQDAGFTWTKGTCDSGTYLQQRRIFERARAGVASPMAVEEDTIALLDRVIRQACHTDSNRAPQRQREMVHAVETLLGTRFDQPLRLVEIAAQAGASVFHLCRTFRRVTGLPLHGYLKQLRIRHGLERVCDSRAPFSVIATDLGFTHHSHFTNVFHRAFDATPSSIRAQITSVESHGWRARY